MRRYRFEWRGDYYCLDPVALAFWPEARVVVPPDQAERLRLVTTHAQFIAFALSVGGEIDEALPEADPCVIAREELKRLHYKSATIPQVIALIEQHPDAALARRSIEVLLQWFIIERDIRLAPKKQTPSEGKAGDDSQQ